MFIKIDNMLFDSTEISTIKFSQRGYFTYDVWQQRWFRPDKLIKASEYKKLNEFDICVTFKDKEKHSLMIFLGTDESKALEVYNDICLKLINNFQEHHDKTDSFVSPISKL